MRRLATILAGLLLGALPLRAESLVVVGAGQSGTWDTEFSFANGTSDPITVQEYLTASPPFPCISPCNVAYVTVPANGTATVWMSSLIGGPLRTLYFTPLGGDALPTMRARVVNRYAAPDEAVELPVLRLQTALDMNASVFVFPSVKRSDAIHSNLAIGSVNGYVDFPVSIMVEAFGSDGTRLGSGTFSSGTANNIFLIDVLHQLGVDSLDDGQIRVTKVSGDGVLWGELAVLDTAGHVQISLGRNP